MLPEARPSPARRGPGSGSLPSVSGLQCPLVSWAPWASCHLILRSLVLVTAPQKSCAGHSAESSKTCSQPAIMQWPHHRPASGSYRPSASLSGRQRASGDTGTWTWQCVKWPTQSLGLGTKRNGSRGTVPNLLLSRVPDLRGPSLRGKTQPCTQGAPV